MILILIIKTIFEYFELEYEEGEFLYHLASLTQNPEILSCFLIELWYQFVEGAKSNPGM